MGTPEYVGGSASVSPLSLMLYFPLNESLFFFFLAPEILNYEPISTATDMW